jgi:hypothetical protein
MPFIAKLLMCIGHFFSGIFNAAEHAWKNIQPEVRDALQQASGFVSVINNNLDGSPAFVLELIGQRFGITQDQVHATLIKAAEQLNLVGDIADPDPIAVMKKLQEYLSKKEGPFWAQASNGLANVLAVILAPAGTKYAKISLLMEYVYQTFFRKDKKVLAPAA